MADVQQQFPFIPRAEAPGQMIRRLAFYSVLMIILPLFSYFFSKTILFEGLFGMTSSNSYFYAAIVAIIAVHFFLAVFIYIAFKDGDKPSRLKE